jgi:hypothetical protein
MEKDRKGEGRVRIMFKNSTSAVLSLALGMLTGVSIAQSTANDEEAPAPPPPPPNCKVSDFRNAVLDYPEADREKRALAWIEQEGKNCSLDRLVLIRNNRNQWMGTGDSVRVASAVEGLIETAAKDDPVTINGLFNSPPPPAPKKDK